VRHFPGCVTTPGFTLVSIISQCLRGWSQSGLYARRPTAATKVSLVEMGDGARYKETALVPDNVLTVKRARKPASRLRYHSRLRLV